MKKTELDRLEEYLAEPARQESALPLDAIQGLFCAVASAPAPIPPARWIPEVLGEGHEFQNEDEAHEITALLMRFYEDTAKQLNGGEGLEFILYGAEDDEEELAVWCEGYLMGTNLAEPSWDESAEPEDVDEMLFPFMALSGRLKEVTEESGEPWMDEKEEKRMLAEMREGLADSVLANREFWFEKSIPATVRREAPKVGRNDPCSCGSGKKFKNCCGAG
jgi:uncharacterized protein